MVSPSPPVAVLQAVAVAGGGQKPMFAKAEIEAARNTSSRVSFRVTFSPKSLLAVLGFVRSFGKLTLVRYLLPKPT
jgi:hypothetical protein